MPIDTPKLFHPSVEQSLGFADCCRRGREGHPFRAGYPSPDEVLVIAYIVTLADEVLRLRDELRQLTTSGAGKAMAAREIQR